MKYAASLIALSVFALSASALAEEPAAPAPERPDRGAFIAGAKLGGVIPFDGLSPMVSGVLELGYALPWMNRSLAVLVDVGYTVPATSGTAASDPRVEGGKYDWRLTQKELTIMPAVAYRLTKLGRVVPYVGIGPRIYLLESVVGGAVGSQVIRETTERSTKVGFGLPLGVELKLGPGALIGELLFEWGPLNHVTTGDGTNTMGGSLQIGYRFLI